MYPKKIRYMAPPHSPPRVRGPRGAPLNLAGALAPVAPSWLRLCLHRPDDPLYRPECLLFQPGLVLHRPEDLLYM